MNICNLGNYIWLLLVCVCWGGRCCYIIWAQPITILHNFFPFFFLFPNFFHPRGPSKSQILLLFYTNGFPLSLLDSSSYQNIYSQAVNSSLIETLVHACVCRFSCLWLFATLWTGAYQAPLSMEFSRQEHWSGCHALLQGGTSQPRVVVVVRTCQSIRTLVCINL